MNIKRKTELKEKTKFN